MSFLKIQVYLIRMYVARGDMRRLVRASVGSGKSALVQGEKEDVKRRLLGGEGSGGLVSGVEGWWD